jgi:DNA-binding response OmpR family regulator
MGLKRVLIVEDSIEVGRMYQDSIRSAYPGVPITFVPSAEEGILEASRYSFDLLIADIRLPGMSGFDLVRKVRARQPEVKVVMVTGLKIDSDLEKQSLQVGAELLLPKPLSVSDFLAAVEKVTGEVAQAGAAEVEAARSKRTGRTGALRRAVSEPKTEPRSGQHSVDTAPGGAKNQSEPPTLGAVLGDLRGSLGALAVILLDDQGRVMAQAGDWPSAGLEASLVPAVMSGLSALEKLSLQIRPGLPAAAHALRGQTFDLAFAPVGSFAVLVFLRASTGALRLALAFDQLLSTQTQLARILEGMGLIIRPVTGALPLVPVSTAPEVGAASPVEVPPPAVPEPEPVPEDPVKLHALEALLGTSIKSPQKVDADAFWDQVTSGETPSAPSSGALSYEQAKKLGLVEN